ncbi:MAG TPA: endo-1,4-beta-xylanase [Victivallales bacterium]|nr:endo-1,4-beta-xylanase [Victivallales bacterium]
MIKKRKILGVILIMIQMAFISNAQENNNPKGTSIIHENAIENTAILHNKNKKAEITKIKSDRNGNNALRISLEEHCENPWDVEIIIPCINGISKGDAIIVSAWMRTIVSENETGEAYISEGLQRNKDPYEKPIWGNFNLPREWTLIEFGQISELDIDGKDLAFALHMGKKPQSIDIENLKIVSLGKNVEKLPKLKLSYQGRENNAKWRNDAEKRIEKIRKGKILVKVVDPNDKPIKDAKITISMTKHAFPFGTCVKAKYLGDEKNENDSNVQKYRQEFLKLFNCAVIENYLKPPHWEKTEEQKIVLNALKWLKENNIMVRGHTAIWPSEKYFAPSWLKIAGITKEGKLKDVTISEAEKDKLNLAIKNHIYDVLSKTRGYCFQWDVINEPYTNHSLMDIFGDSIMIEWFKIAKNANSDALLCINDYGIVNDEEHANHYIKTIKYLLENGAPLEGIGEQGHYGAQPPSIEKVIKTYDMLGAFGLPVICTEFDIDTDDEDLQADFTRDYMTALFSHPACKGFLMWGFWEKAHWRHKAAMLRSDWSPKQNYKIYCDLVFSKWWTKESGITDKNGEYSTRAFYGDYEISVKKDEKTKFIKAKHINEGTQIKIKLD